MKLADLLEATLGLAIIIALFIGAWIELPSGMGGVL